SVVLFRDVSGSCTINVKLTAFGRIFFHSNFGETGFSTVRVNLAGITPPSGNSAAVIVSPALGGGGLFGSCAALTPIHKVPCAAQKVVPRLIFMVVLPIDKT